MIFLDLVGIQIIAAVTDQDGLSQSLIQGMTQVLPVVGDQVEIGDVQNIITIDLILHINGLSIVSTAQQLDLLGLLLVVALLITHSLQLSLTGISTTGADTAVRRLVNAIDNTGHPGIIGIQDLGLSRVDELVLGHQHTHGLLVKRIVLQLVLLLIDLTSLSKTADAGLLRQLQNLIHVGVSQNILLTIILLVKHIVLHRIISFLIFIGFVIADAGIFQRLTDHCINDGLLFFAKCIKHIGDGLLVLGSIGFGLFNFFGHFRILLIFILGFNRCMNHDVFIPASIQFLNFAINGIITVGHNKVNVCARVCACKNQTQLLNIAMKDFLPAIGRITLTKLICPDRKGTHITVINKFLCCLTGFGVVKISISINAFVTVLKKCMAKNGIGVVMIMVIHQGNFFSVIVFESIFLDDPTVSANKVVASRPSRKIAIRILSIRHFDFLLPHSILHQSHKAGSLDRFSAGRCCCFSVHLPSDHQTVSFRQSVESR